MHGLQLTSYNLLQLVKLVTLKPWKLLTAQIQLPIFDHEERDMQNDQDSVGGDNFAEFSDFPRIPCIVVAVQGKFKEHTV